MPAGGTSTSPRLQYLPDDSLDGRWTVCELYFTARAVCWGQLERRHAKACALAGLEPLPPYTFRHTCLTHWSSHMDPYTLAYFAGHSDFATTRRYVHPNLDTARATMERRLSAPSVIPLCRGTETL